ncbi:MAG: hypothetical protein WD042_06650 [Phycisphaeraceae bacterium]
MTSSISISRTPWFDRWSKPSLEQLLDPLKPHHRRQFDRILAALAELEVPQSTIVWYGASWKWTLQYTYTPLPPVAAPPTGKAAKDTKPAKSNGHNGHGKTNGNGHAKANGHNIVTRPAPTAALKAGPSTALKPGKIEPGTLCYLVPKLETPLICVPLSDNLVEVLSHKRLSAFIRDGIRVAKCAVQIHWATWMPNSEAECEFLMDLLKRKIQHAPEVQAPRADTRSAR